MATTTAVRARPLAVGALLAAAAGYVALHDPLAEGSVYLPCVVHSTTGFWCPGCGLTRGTHALLTGRPIEAMSINLFTPAVVIMVVGGWLAWTASSFGRTVPAWWEGLRELTSRPRVFGGMLALLVGYAVLRNIPAEPFAGLAP